jgi:predicted nucleotidyltransferase
MGKRTIRNLNELKRFREVLDRRFKIDKLILFGSRARGKHKAHSDYDFIVISKKFEGIDWNKRQSMLYPLWDFESLETGADFLCYTPSEFENKRKKANICSFAEKEGIEI